MLLDLLEDNPGLGLTPLILYLLYYCTHLSLKNDKQKPWRLSFDWVEGFLYLFVGAGMIENAYRKAKGKPFAIYTPERKNIMVTSPAHIKELDFAPRHQLSFHAVVKDMLQPKITMHGFQMNDQRGVEGTGFVKAVRSLLTFHLPQFIPTMQSTIAEQLSFEFSRQASRGGVQEASIFNLIKCLVTRTNAVVFFGQTLADDPELYGAISVFPQNAYIAGEIVRLLPATISSYLASLATKKHHSAAVMHCTLVSVINERLSKADEYDVTLERPKDGLQWIIDTAPKKEKWTSERIAHEMMGVWYGSVHTLALALTWAVIDLYTHTEYVEPLREELESYQFEEFLQTANRLPALDSFLKESARLNAFESIGVRRQALESFSFSGGLHVAKGDWLCIPHSSMMKDSAYLPEPLRFDGFRWLQKQPQGMPQKFTDASNDAWLVWGASRTLCPGRFYAVTVMKLIISQLVLNYDCKMKPYKGSPFFTWRSAVVPKPSLTLQMQAR